MKVFAIVLFAGIWASSSAQYQPSYTLTAPAPYQPAPPPQPSFQPSYQPPVYSAKPSYGPVSLGMPVPYTYPSPAPPGENL